MSVLSQSAEGATTLLAIDTACAACSAALWSNGAVVASARRDMRRGHAEALMPMVAAVMDDARTEFSSLDLIAVTIGPGSFTGLRTGLAAARGLALARSLPLMGVTTTEAVALAAFRLAPPDRPRRPITVVLNSRRADLYVQRFGADLAPLCDPFTATPDEIAHEAPANGVVFAGDAADQIMDIVRTETDNLTVACLPVSGPDAAFVAEIAAHRWSSRSVEQTSFSNELLYLRAPEAVEPVARGRLRR